MMGRCDSYHAHRHATQNPQASTYQSMHDGKVCLIYLAYCAAALLYYCAAVYAVCICCIGCMCSICCTCCVYVAYAVYVVYAVYAVHAV